MREPVELYQHHPPRPYQHRDHYLDHCHGPPLMLMWMLHLLLPVVVAEGDDAPRALDPVYHAGWLRRCSRVGQFLLELPTMLAGMIVPGSMNVPILARKRTISMVDTIASGSSCLLSLRQQIIHHRTCWLRSSWPVSHEVFTSRYPHRLASPLTGIQALGPIAVRIRNGGPPPNGH